MRIEPNPLIADQISFDLDSNTISFKGDKMESLSTLMIVDIRIILVNVFGENVYSQSVIVYPWQVSPDEEASNLDKD